MAAASGLQDHGLYPTSHPRTVKIEENVVAAADPGRGSSSRSPEANLGPSSGGSSTSRRGMSRWRREVVAAALQEGALCPASHPRLSGSKRRW